jgi:hypothetical protein
VLVPTVSDMSLHEILRLDGCRGSTLQAVATGGSSTAGYDQAPLVGTLYLLAAVAASVFLFIHSDVTA